MVSKRRFTEVRQIYSCPKCGKGYKESHRKPYDIPKTSTKHGGKNHTLKQIIKGQDVRLFRPAPPAKQIYAHKWLDLFDEGKVKLLPSAKLIAVINQIRLWIQEAPDDKIIVFSQFRQFQILIGAACEDLNIAFLYFSVGSK